MGFIGVQPTSAPLTASDITDGIVSNAKLGADSVNATKIADDSISEEHLDPTIITGLSALAEAPADTDEFIISDGGVLKRIDASFVGGGGELVKLAQSRSTTGTNAVAFENIWDDATYSFYKVFACIDPANDGSEVRFRWHDSSGELTNSVYRGQTSRQYRDNSNSGTGQNYGFWGQSYATLSWATSSDYYGNAFISMDLFPRTYSEFSSRCNFTLSTQDDSSSPQEQNYVGAFLYDNNASLDNGGFRFELNSGQVTAHDVCVYGFKK